MCATTFGVVPSPKSGSGRAPRAPGRRGGGRVSNACRGQRRLGGIVAVAVVIAGLSGPATAHAQEVVANCDFPFGRDHCNRWYTTPWVSVSWQLDPGGMIVSGCSANTFTAETTPVEQRCTVSWSNSTEVRKTVWIGIDRTPPSVVSFTPERPPDHNGWFNHPVSLTFQGTDSVSGIASCSSTIFAGPEGQDIPVRGACTDHAGHSAAGALPINYDATPPSPPAVGAMPGNRKVRLKWTRSPETSSEPVRRARYYNVQVFRGQRKVLSSWPERPRQPLKRRWTDAGRSYRLLEGRYCWHVWPGYGKRSERRYGKRLGSSCFRVIR